MMSQYSHSPSHHQQNREQLSSSVQHCETLWALWLSVDEGTLLWALWDAVQSSTALDSIEKQGLEGS